MKAKSFRNLNLGLRDFLGISAISGGGVLIISLSKNLLSGLPLSILAKSPLTDFLFSGIILFFVLGFFSLLGSICLIHLSMKKVNDKIPSRAFSSYKRGSSSKSAENSLFKLID